jgi:uncharacterized protein (DUF885 family)
MFKKIAILFVLFLVGCSSSPSVDSQFESMATNCLSTMRELSPEWSTSLGDHRFDDKTTNYSLAGFQTRRDFAQSYLDSLGEINRDKLSDVNRIDLDILTNQLKLSIFQHDEIADHKWNPLVYNSGDGIYTLLARDFAPLQDRLMSVKARLEQLPATLEAARVNLIENPPETHTKRAMDQNAGNIGLILDDLGEFLKNEPEMKRELQSARSAAIAALEKHSVWLEEELLPRSDGDFRLGEEKFRKKLRYTLDSDLTLEEILEAAWIDLENTQRKMYLLAKPLYAELYPEAELPENRELVKQVMDRLAEDRPEELTIVAEAQAGLKRCTEFVIEHDLVTVPADPVEIILMPEFQRGYSIAYCDSPGPFAENETTFYAIAPPPLSWSDEQRESFYREYNDYMLEDLTIHEAMPGHFLQIAHANAFSAPTATRAMLGSGVFVEGWAVYAEQVMAEHGYGGPKVQLQQLKMRLRVAINSIIDQEIHCRGMSKEKAIKLMMEQGYQEEGEALGKWYRANQSSTQLSTYFVGVTEMNLLRDSAKKNDNFDLKKFHDELISYGSPAPKYVRELMGL